MSLTLLLLLILLNGLFAMSEIAVVSSRKAKLQIMVDNGATGSIAALSLHQNPSSFLSTIQVGITSAGILIGAIGEDTISEPLVEILTKIPLLAPYSEGISLTITVITLTYFSVVMGELVPKRLALLAPESIASLVARPMSILARLAHPLVSLLTGSSTFILTLVGARRKDEPPVTDEEIRAMMEQGSQAGVFHENEQEIVYNVLRLDERCVASIMTPRHDMFVIDLEEGEETVRQKIIDSEHSRMLVCRDGLTHVIGVLQTGDLLKKAMLGHSVAINDIEAVLHPPLYVPESITTAKLLENFRMARLQFALVVDEYGAIQGLVTMADVLAAIVGEISNLQSPKERNILRRDDGSWLVDGDVSIERMKSVLEIDNNLLNEDRNNFNTLGGFIMHELGHIPIATDYVEKNDWRFEVMNMDHNRVDKVLVSRLSSMNL